MSLGRPPLGPGSLSAAAVEAAALRLAPYIRRTPLVRSSYLSQLTGGSVYLKLECWQQLGSFKVRGMANRVLTLTETELARGLVVASSGNHGVAASWCGQRWGVPVDVFAPRPTPAAKVDKIRRFGGRLHLVGDDYDQAHLAARDFLAEGQGGVWVDSSADPAAVAGHGTIGLEIAEQLPGVEEVLVPVGGGGLVTGIGLVLKAARRGTAATPVVISGVQTAACPAMLASLRDGVRHEVYPSAGSICEALVGGVGDLGFRMAPECLDRVVLAGETAIERAVVELLREEQVLAEPSALVGWAYVREHPGEFAGRETVIVVSGANIDHGLLRRLVARYV